MIHAVCNTKGGSGKTSLAFHCLCSEASRLGKNFDIIEVDEKNSSTTVFVQSKILTNKGKTLRLDNVTRAMGEALYQSLTQDKEIIIDIGGGTDTDVVIDALRATNEPIRYYVPTLSKSSQVENIKQTYEMIEQAGGKPNLVINQADGWTAESSGAIDIFGDQANEIQREILLLEQTEKIYYIPRNEFFGDAEREFMLIGDYIKQGYLPLEVIKKIIAEGSSKEAKKNGTSQMDEYTKRWMYYSKIKKAFDFYQNIAAQNLLG